MMELRIGSNGKRTGPRSRDDGFNSVIVMTIGYLKYGQVFNAMNLLQVLAIGYSNCVNRCSVLIAVDVTGESSRLTIGTAFL